MSTSCKTSFGFAAFLLLIVLPFHNCTVDKNIRFSDLSLSKVSESLRSESNGSGGAYLGKPGEGEYLRRFPGYLCENSPIGDQGQLFVKNDLRIVSDNCNKKDIQFNFADSIISFSGYNPDYLAVGSAIYELKNPAVKEPLITEVLCSMKQSDFNLDIVTKIDNSKKSAKAKIYLSINKKARTTEDFDIDRSEEGKSLVYSSKALILRVEKPLASSLGSSGYFESMVDNIFYSGKLNCRVASSAPVEEMGTTLTSLYPLNSFTSDQQESVCSHSGILSCDNFEDRTSAADLARAKSFNLGWQWEPGNYSISNISFDGAKSFEAQYAANASGSGTNGFSFPASSEIYLRYYAKWSSNFVFSPHITGLFSLFGVNGDLTMKTGFKDDGTLILFMNGGPYTSSFKPSTNEWYCFEAHIRSASSLSTSDGIAEIWVNGIKAIESPPLKLTDTMDVWGFYGNWYCTDADNNSICDDPAYSHPMQSVHFDNVVISKQRVGCF